jgi:hypothetical protein
MQPIVVRARRTDGDGAAMMPEKIGRFRIRVLGPLRVSAPDGRDATPRGRRARAALGALAVAREGRRGRAWLQALLWSDRTEKRGSDSLRQCLTEIRRAFGDESALLSEDGAVALNPARVAVDLAAEVARAQRAGGAPPEFLEGLDIPDPEFEDWVRDMRSHLAARIGEDGIEVADAAPHLPSGPHFVIATRAAPTESPTARLFAEAFNDSVARSLAENGATLVYDEDAGNSATERLALLRLSTAGVAVDGEAALSARLMAGDDARVLWSGRWAGSAALSTLTDNAALMNLCCRARDAAVDALLAASEASEAARAAALGYVAQREMFEMTPRGFQAADALLAEAAELDDRPAFSAWRAVTRAHMLVERSGGDPAALAEEAEAFAADALERGPDSAAVLAGASHARLIVCDDVEGAAELAQRCVALDPFEPWGWSSLANALLRSRREPEALAYSRKAHGAARHSRARFWWDMNACVASALNGHIEDAIRFAEAAHRMRPSFKPPLRYAAMLNLFLGRREAFEVSFETLRQLEPELDIEGFFSDGYPMRTIQLSEVFKEAHRMRSWSA